MWNKKYLLALPLVLVLLMLPAVIPRPQNPLEMGAMTIAGVLTETIQGGGAMRKDIDMETPIFTLRSKSEIGMGDAIRPRTNSDSDSDSSEHGSRRKRSTKDNAIWIWQPMSHNRIKRSPCIWNTAGGGGNGGGGNGNNGGGAGNEDEDYTDPVDNRRRKRAKQRKHTTRQSKRSSSSKTRKTKKSYSIHQDKQLKNRLWRTRRQIQGITEMNDMNENMGMFGQNNGGSTPPKITDWVQGIWNSFLNTMTDVTQYMKQTISTAQRETLRP